MEPLKFKYGLDEVPPFGELVFLGLQWLAIMIPIVVIIGNIVAGLHFDKLVEQIGYMQKVFFVVGASLLVQLLWGHRLPLVTGPATILLVGIAAGRASGPGAIYTALALGGLILFLLSVAGLFRYLEKLFTPPVVATILIMIAFTLTPMILDLSTSSALPELAWANLCFVLIFVLCIFAVNKHVGGFWRSTLIMWALIAGTVVYWLVFPRGLEGAPAVQTNIAADFLFETKLNLNFEPGVIISFLVSFLALAINDLGSIYSVGGLIKPDRMPERVVRGLSLTGVLNFLSGLGGVIGPVNFSLSPGVIASTGCASRFTLVPAGLILLALSFLPSTIAFIGGIPSVVVGGVFLYIMCSQIAAGLIMVVGSEKGFYFENGLVIGLPLMLSVIVSFLPDGVLNTFPLILRPLLGNGFVVGVLAVMVMEHLVFREKRGDEQ
ncbi:MAG: purine/pyrimidine permease [Firmicutes bacterium]|nr:purine/pyrimidine permease [Bacillota bacterium]